MIFPKHLFRNDDGMRFTRQSNNKYTMDKSYMNPAYEYTYEVLISHGFVDSIKKCNIVEYRTKNDGHGDYD